MRRPIARMKRPECGADFKHVKTLETKRKEKEKKSVEENSLLFETVGSRKET